MKRNYSPLRQTKHIVHWRAIILVAVILLTVLFARIIYTRVTDTLNQPTVCYKTDIIEINKYISSGEDFTGATVESLVQKYKLQYGEDAVVIIPVNEK